MQVEASVESSVMVVWSRGAKNSMPQMRWLSVALATTRNEMLRVSELRFGWWRGCYNSGWTEGVNDTCGVQRPWVAGRVRILIGLMRRSRLQRTTTTGLISCDAGEHCLVSFRAGNKRQRMEEIPLRWNRCRHHLREGVVVKRVLWQLVESHPVRVVLRW